MNGWVLLLGPLRDLWLEVNLWRFRVSGVCSSDIGVDRNPGRKLPAITLSADFLQRPCKCAHVPLGSAHAHRIHKGSFVRA